MVLIPMFDVYSPITLNELHYIPIWPHPLHSILA